MGRPKKEFNECSDRAKRYKVQQLEELYPKEQIQAAAKKIHTTNSKKNHKKYMDLTKALAILMDAELSKHQYEVIRNALKDCGYNVFPPYYLLVEEKKKCYPEHVTITETSAKIELQNLLDHTAKRLIETKSQEDLTTISDELTLVTKWGCDGSRQTQYHQKFAEDTEKDVSDANLFMVSMVPLVLQSSLNEKIWENTRPSSTRYCRPIQFEFVKETREKTVQIVQQIEEKVRNLEPSTILIYGKNIKIIHKLIFTMIDGKVANAVTGTKSTLSCYICKAMPKEMNDLDNVKSKPPDENAYILGLSPLHARIKFMECILHISYNLSFQKWSTDSKTKIEKIKKGFRKNFEKNWALELM